MSRTTPPPIDTSPELSEVEKLQLKHETITFANKHRMRYIDYGWFIVLVPPKYSDERIAQDSAIADQPTTYKRNHKRSKAKA